MSDIEDLQALPTLRYAGSLEYAEDFMREWRATIRDPEGRAALTIAYQQAQRDGEERGGQRCCGTTSDWHRPWCDTGPRRYREQEQQDEPGYPCCGGYYEHGYRCPNRVWPATATPEIRRQAIRGDCIAPAHAKIEDLVRGLDYQQRKRLTEILAGIWDDGCEYGRRIAADDGPIAEGTVRDD